MLKNDEEPTGRPAAPAPAANGQPEETARPAKVESITLETPITRGGQVISEVQLRKPKPGEMRGLQMQSVLQGDVNSILALLPRISNPPLLPQEVENLEPEDFASMTGAVMGFFMSKADMAMIMKAYGQEMPNS